ncbi:hypothetical protein, partial [Brevibacillus laterosporus]|uniref:hypothetical protein n=1 Tax=Brevibacillus laterosporus TaxID=1465 RepID=UPI0019D3BF01
SSITDFLSTKNKTNSPYISSIRRVCPQSEELTSRVSSFLTRKQRLFRMLLGAFSFQLDICN